MATQGFYKTLGVAPDANEDEIKRAFRKAARKYHPDINKGAGAEAKFKEVNEACEVLKDPGKRTAYGQFGQDLLSDHAHAYSAQDWEQRFGSFGAGPHNGARYNDIFEDLFRRDGGSIGGMGASLGSSCGPGSHARLDISIEDALDGASRNLHFRMPVVGPGGRVNLTDRKPAVRIPKGNIEGQHIRLAGQGTPSLNGGEAGDLFIEIAFARHPVHRPDGRDLHLDLPVTPWEAGLGGKIIMATRGGTIDLRIPENARGGQKLRVKGKSLPGKPAGDIYATLKIVNPKVSNEHA